MRDLNSQNFDKEIEGSSRAIVDFWAPWCSPCRAQTPILEQLDENEVDVFKVNVDENQALAKRFGIVSIPSLLVFSKGELINRSVGLHTLEQLKKLIEEKN